MGIFTAETIYTHMNTAHGTIHGDAPAAPGPLPYIGFAIDIEEQRVLLRQAEARRANALHDAHLPWYYDYAERAREEERERMERLRLQRQREMEERERRLREQRLLREAEQRRRERERQEGGGWGCTIM